MSASTNPDLVVDSRGELCPLPVVKLSLGIDGLKPGQVLKLLATDPGSKSDVPAWSKATGHKLLEAAESDGVYSYLLQKKGG